MKSTKTKLICASILTGLLALAACSGNSNSQSSRRQLTRRSTSSENSEAIDISGGDNNSNNGGGQNSDASSSSSKKSSSKTDNPSVKYNVTIDYGDSNKQTLQVGMGESLSKPDDPDVPNGMTFYGWKNKLNGGQIWDFEKDDLNVVMSDVYLEPCFVDESLTVQLFEAELCPAISAVYGQEVGMPGATYSGGQQGKGLIGRDYDNQFGTTGYDDSTRAYVHFMYIKGDTLTWELYSNEAAENVTFFARFSAEYGLMDPVTDERYSIINDEGFPIKVNGESLKYGTIKFHNIPEIGQILTFQDYFISASVSLKEGKNVIEMIVDNEDTLNGTIASSAPCIDSIKLYSTSELEWPDACYENLERD